MFQETPPPQNSCRCQNNPSFIRSRNPADSANRVSMLTASRVRWICITGVSLEAIRSRNSNDRFQSFPPPVQQPDRCKTSCFSPSEEILPARQPFSGVIEPWNQIPSYRLTSSEMDDALLTCSKPLDVENVSQIKPALDYIRSHYRPQSGFRTWLMPAASVRHISEKFSRHL